MSDKSLHPDVRLVTDGACSGNPGPGGWACPLSSGGRTRELSCGAHPTTNNRMELTALLEGLRALKRPCQVHVVSDSKYVIDAVGQRWLEKWQAKNWKSVKNPDLAQAPVQAAVHTLWPSSGSSAIRIILRTSPPTTWPCWRGTRRHARRRLQDRWVGYLDKN